MSYDYRCVIINFPTLAKHGGGVPDWLYTFWTGHTPNFAAVRDVTIWQWWIIYHRSASECTTTRYIYQISRILYWCRCVNLCYTQIFTDRKIARLLVEHRPPVWSRDAIPRRPSIISWVSPHRAGHLCIPTERTQLIESRGPTGTVLNPGGYETSRRNDLTIEFTNWNRRGNA